MNTKYNIGDIVTFTGTISSILIDEDGDVSYKLLEVNSRRFPEDQLMPGALSEPPEESPGTEPDIKDRIAAAFGYNKIP